MFDFGSGELLVIGVVALVVIGPKELPGLLRTVGQAVAKMRRIAGDFQGQFQEALREADLHDAVKSVSDIQSSLSTSVSDATSFNDPLAHLTPPIPPVAPPLPVELNGPVMKAGSLSPSPIVASSSLADPSHDASANPKPGKSKKTKASKLSAADDPQAALFDTLETMAKKDRTLEKSKDKAKAKPKAKAKSASKTPAKWTAKSKPARKAKPKSKEASS